MPALPRVGPCPAAGASCTIIRTLRLAETGEMLLYLAMSRILLRRLTPKER
jgi:hypothetical protein